MKLSSVGTQVYQNVLCKQFLKSNEMLQINRKRKVRVEVYQEVPCKQFLQSEALHGMLQYVRHVRQLGSCSSGPQKLHLWQRKPFNCKGIRQGSSSMSTVHLPTTAHPCKSHHQDLCHQETSRCCLHLLPRHVPGVLQSVL